MQRSAFRKDIRRTIAKTKTRVASIAGLVALGSFSFVGLRISGSDMRITGAHYFNELQLADLVVVGDYGLVDNDIELIQQTELRTSKETLETEKENGEQQIESAKEELEAGEELYSSKYDEYLAQKETVETKIADGEAEIASAKDQLEHLGTPTYSVYTRREAPGSEGYKNYGDTARIVDATGNIMSLFMYLVAALVVVTTMTRLVDEDRTNAGVLKSLGYSNRSIIAKYVIYGGLSSFVGNVVGIILGHILVPLVMYSTYQTVYSYPKIELHFSPGLTLVATLLSLGCGVIPASVVARKYLNDKVRVLLRPKPPTKGVRILAERITPLWRRLKFSNKVTARNIFRNKRRMAMTIFGVAGAVMLLFVGYSMKYSISKVGPRQFEELQKFDLIVAKESYVTIDQEEELDALLHSDYVESSFDVVYESLTKELADGEDQQPVSLLVPESVSGFNNYMKLVRRTNGKKINLNQEGAVITDRLAQITGLKEGDMMNIKTGAGKEIEVEIVGVAEMYIGHFMFMNRDYYESIFGREFFSNAKMVQLASGSMVGTDKIANKFLSLSAVSAVVQKSMLIRQMEDNVESLGIVMEMLILIAILLATVILFNLTNINVRERYRDMSTVRVLGFDDNELTLYIYKETLILTYTGFFVGLLLGELLFRYVLSIIPHKQLFFPPVFSMTAVVIPFLLISAITTVLGLVIRFTAKRIDMVASLKSVE